MAMSDKERIGKLARKIHKLQMGGTHFDLTHCHACDEIAEVIESECALPWSELAHIKNICENSNPTYKIRIQQILAAITRLDQRGDQP